GLVLGDHRLSQQNFTGITYSDAHALLPAKTILTFIALICALLFFANVVRRTWLLPGLGLGLLVLSSVLLGWLWPTVVQAVQVRPNEPDRERPFIEYNINATRYAYGVSGASVKPYTVKTKAEKGQLAEDGESVPGIRLVDPTVVPSTFEQLQQIRGFYSFANPLDVDRYEIDGKTRDAVVAVREIDLEGVPQDQQNWNNNHTVFTHGYGFVSAYGNQKNSEGGPVWMEGGIPPTGDLGKFEPRVYYGEKSPDYSIVGRPKGAPPIELDVPSGSGEGESSYTYKGKGGVPIGSFFDRVLFAAKFQDVNLLLSERVNENSKILFDRSPRDRVQKVAPWLTLDSDPYPAVVDGRVVWIVDGYTMADSYPMSQRLDVRDATSDSLTPAPAIVGQPSAQVNYVRNSVKAVVDAYDGTVDLYAWEESDPLLRTWMKSFPGTVKPKKEMPDELLDHVRYPEDMMKLQREILGQYHVTDPKVFYEGTERWRVPADPTKEEQGLKQPAYFLSVRMPDQEKPVFSLTSTYIYYNRENLAAFVAVDADARSKDYGKIRVLSVAGVDDGSGQEDGQEQVDGPKQLANKLESDQAVRDALLPFRQQGSNTKIVNGNLLTLPAAGGLLYVQPVYVQRTGEGSYPLLRLVLASYGGRIGVDSTLQGALDKIFEGQSGADTEEDGDTDGGQVEPPPDDGEDTGGPVPDEVARALDEANEAFDKADAALKAGNLAEYEKFVRQARAAVARALDAGADVEPGQNPGQNPGQEPGRTSTPAPSRTPSPGPGE
ncbi:MAG TPA: UPF0182 family protein, partial [Actinopolymorphaceae bacterium]